MLFGIAKYIYSRLPYAKYTDTRAESGTVETPRTSETSETGEASTESTSKIKIGEEVELDGVIEPTTSRCTPDPNSPRLPSKTRTGYYTVAPNTANIISYNERSGATVLQDANGNIVTVATAGNPFIFHSKTR